MPLKPVDLRDLHARIKMATVDIVLNFLLFTPLLVLHYDCTAIMLDTLFMSWLPWLGATLLFIIGVTGQFLLTFYQRRIPGLLPESVRRDRMCLLVVARLYTLLLVTLNICHITAVTFFFENFTDGVMVSTVKACTTAIMVLWALKAGRNTVCAPLYLSIDYDTDIDNFHEFSTVFRSQPNESQDSLMDSLLTNVVVYTFIHLYWAAVTGVQDILFIPSLPFISMLISLILGLSGCALLIFFQHPACELSKEFEKENDVKRIAFEDLFQFVASIAAITYWRGVTLCFDFFMGLFPLYWRGFDVTALVGWIMSYLMLILVHLTNSLPFKGCDLDGDLTDGKGCLFATAYFLDLLADDKKICTQAAQPVAATENGKEATALAPSGEPESTVRQRYLLNNNAVESPPSVNAKEKAKTTEADGQSHLKQA